MGICFDCYNSEDGVCDFHKKQNEKDFINFTSTISTYNEVERLEKQVRYLRKKLDRRKLFSVTIFLLLVPIFFMSIMVAKYNLLVFIMFVVFVIYTRKLLSKFK